MITASVTQFVKMQSYSAYAIINKNQRKIELSSNSSFSYFLKRKLFYILENKKPEKCFMFQATELSYISGGTSKAPKAKMFSISPKTL